MKNCELCGAILEGEMAACPRCGFEFPKKVYSDIRDNALLKKYEGKTIETVQHDLKDKTSLLTSHFENLDMNEYTTKEIITSVEETLDFLQIPTVIGLGHELKFTDREEKLINALMSKLEQVESDQGSPVASARAYTKLANATHCLGDVKTALKMVNKALLKEPNNPDALFGKAKLLFYEKKYNEAKRYLDKLLAKSKKDQNSLYLAEMIEQIILSENQ
jgi:tetratricopeptide (TPR) repeat protein